MTIHLVESFGFIQSLTALGLRQTHKRNLKYSKKNQLNLKSDLIVLHSVSQSPIKHHKQN
jgi:hypothetical protein